MGGEPPACPFHACALGGQCFCIAFTKIIFQMGGEPPIPPAAQGGQVCQKILCAPVGRCDNFIDKGPACFAKIIRCCVLFGLDVFASSRWSLYSVTCIPRKPSPRNNVYPKGCGGDRKAPTRERAQVSQSKPKR